MVAGSARAESDFLLFPAIEVVHRSGLDPGDPLEQDEFIPAADFFYAGTFGRLRLLGELYVREDGQELERIQLGWSFATGHTLWLGRFHTPLAYWHTRFHHGAYLQTSISVPSAILFEEDGGPLPIHLAGVLAEGALGRGEGEIGYALGLWLGPALKAQLEALDILEPGEGPHKAGAGLRLSYRPDAAGPTEVGFFAGRTGIPADDPAIGDVEQTVAGLYGNREHGRTRLMGTVFAVQNRLGPPGRRSEASFSSAYVQVEYRWPPRWTGYGRIEGTSGAGDDPYRAQFPHLIVGRVLLGGRWDLSRRQALKLEFASNRHEDHDFESIRLQWSAAFP